jgi:hypothetical protein
MPWARLDDHFHGHPKVVTASLGALGLYALGLSYCADQLTDGYLPPTVFAAWTGWKVNARELVRARLWETDGDGFRVHGYLEWNDSREYVLSKRDLDRLRKNHVANEDPELVNARQRFEAARKAQEGRHVSSRNGNGKVVFA